MCVTCGCGEGAAATLVKVDGHVGGRPVGHGQHHPTRDGHDHPHEHDDGHDHSHGHTHEHLHEHDPEHGHHDARPTSILQLEARVLAKNDTLAAKNRAWLARRESLALNLVSSPGSGKTTLLERTIRDLRGSLPIHVVEGDQATSNDGERIRAAGAPVVQINTGTGCHLEAEMVRRALVELTPPHGAVVMIENVGNLVCPALFDLGERAKVAILSVTEGDDKPEKYPHMFRAAKVLILSKVDLLPHVDFDVERAAAHARSANPAIKVMSLSARTGVGLGGWYDWLREQRAAARSERLASF